MAILPMNGSSWPPAGDLCASTRRACRPTTAQGLTRGIIGLVNKGQPRKPDDWGALRAWAWGAGRGLDYLETDSAVDAKHVGIEGVSRYGKAALVTMAFDPRFAMVLVGSSARAEPHCCAATTARAWRIWPPASTTGWTATSSSTTPPRPSSAA